MSDLSKILKEEYDKQKSTITTQSLIEMIEEMMNLQEAFGLVVERTKPITITYSGIPDIPVSELGWGEPSGDPSAVNIRREQLERFLAPVQGTYLQLNEILGKLEKYFPRNISVKAAGDVITPYMDLANVPAADRTDEIRNAMSFLIFYKALTEIMRNFNESAAGFSFESFLAVLFGGQQVPTGTGTIADLTDSANTPISLKLLREGSAMIGGSYSDLVRDLIKAGADPDYKMHYLVCLKDIRGEGLQATGAIRFYRYYIDAANILELMQQSSATSDYVALPTMKIGNKNVPIFYKGNDLKYMSNGRVKSVTAATIRKQAVNEAKPTTFRLGDLELKYQQVVDQNRDAIMRQLDPSSKEQGYIDAINQYERKVGKSTQNLAGALSTLKGFFGSAPSITDLLDNDTINQYLNLGYYGKDKPTITRQNNVITMTPSRLDKRLREQIASRVRKNLAAFYKLGADIKNEGYLKQDWDEYFDAQRGAGAIKNKATTQKLKSAVGVVTSAFFKGIENNVYRAIAEVYQEAEKAANLVPGTNVKITGFQNVKDSLATLKNLQANDLQGFLNSLKLTKGYLKTENWEFSPAQFTDGMKAANSSVLTGDQEDYFSGMIYIGVPNVLAFANAIKEHLDVKIFKVFEDLRQLTTSLESFYNSGLQDQGAAAEASNEAGEIKDTVDDISNRESRKSLPTAE
jgi:hypothetical protein